MLSLTLHKRWCKLKCSMMRSVLGNPWARIAPRAPSHLVDNNRHTEALTGRVCTPDLLRVAIGQTKRFQQPPFPTFRSSLDPEFDGSPVNLWA